MKDAFQLLLSPVGTLWSLFLFLPPPLVVKMLLLTTSSKDLFLKIWLSVSPKKIAQESLLISLCTIKTLFFKKVWLLRCHEFANVEQSLNITSHQKRTTSRSLGSNPNNLVTSTPTPSLLNRWKVWIARAIGSGSPWMGFPLCINGIIG